MDQRLHRNLTRGEFPYLHLSATSAFQEEGSNGSGMSHARVTFHLPTFLFLTLRQRLLAKGQLLLVRRLAQTSAMAMAWVEDDRGDCLRNRDRAQTCRLQLREVNLGSFLEGGDRIQVEQEEEREIWQG